VHAKAPNTEWHDAYYSSLATAYIDFEASRRRELDGAGDEEAKFYEVSEERIPPSFERLRSAEVHDPLVAAHFPLVGGLEDQLLESHSQAKRAAGAKSGRTSLTHVLLSSLKAVEGRRTRKRQGSPPMDPQIQGSRVSGVKKARTSPHICLQQQGERTPIEQNMDDILGSSFGKHSKYGSMPSSIELDELMKANDGEGSKYGSVPSSIELDELMKVNDGQGSEYGSVPCSIELHKLMNTYE
jgi:hypothetical protein